MSWGEALQRYTLLTVGDGIVTQIPALVISTATGIIVTRAATDAHLSEEISNQVAKYPKSLVMLGVVLLCSSSLRRHVKKLLDRVLPHVSVLAMNEVPGSITIGSFGVVKIDRSLIERDRVADVRDMPDAPAPILPGVPQALPGGAL